MIIARLHGGLGNQLFQYAAGRSLALRLGVPLGLDERRLEPLGLRSARGHFAWQVAAPPFALPPDRGESLARYALWRAFGSRPILRREHGLGFNSGFEHWGDDSYLHGYWQSERYFSDITETLRQDLRIVTPASPRNAEMARRIAAADSVSLHVRRGDYLQIAAHNICTEDYFRRALNRIVDVSGITPTVFVFSDDPAWAIANLSLPYEKVVVDFNGREADYEDLRLMSLCRHNVIANSSFSWWGAWLNANPDKLVAGPTRWFADHHRSNPDILPHDWLAVS